MPDRTPAISAPARLFGLGLLAAPAAGMGVAAVSLSSPPLALGACVIGFTALAFVRKHPVWRPPTAVPVLGLYLVAACWLGADATVSADATSRFARGLVAVLGVSLFAVCELFRTGAEPRRRAGAVCRRLLARPFWPIAPMESLTVPEVLDLKDALREDMSPVVRLMADARPEIRAAGFAALEGRPYWKLNEARLVLNAARATVEPGVRASRRTRSAASATPTSSSKSPGSSATRPRTSARPRRRGYSRTGAAAGPRSATPRRPPSRTPGLSATAASPAWPGSSRPSPSATSRPGRAKAASSPNGPAAPSSNTCTSG